MYNLSLLLQVLYIYTMYKSSFVQLDVLSVRPSVTFVSLILLFRIDPEKIHKLTLATSYDGCTNV